MSSSFLNDAARVIALVCATAVLSGCKTEESGDDSWASVSPSVGVDVLSSYFVQSFDEFEEAAAKLRDHTSRYTLQRHSWSFAKGKVHESYPLSSSRVEYAHATGLTGAGQTVSVVDSGFLLDHETLSGKSFDLPVGGVSADSHGTAVSSVLAGDSSYMIGIAPGADLSLGEFNSMSSLAEATRRAAEIGAVAQNNSWGFPTVSATPEGFKSVFSGGGSEYLDALEAYAEEGVVVFAVDNDSERETSSIMEALPQFRPELEKGWLAVVNAVPSFDSEQITSAERISSACLDAARWCMTADGGWIAASDASDTSYQTVTGSSFAAPQVTGALALLAEAFPSLSPHDLRLRLLASADNGFFAHDGQQELVPGFSHGYGEEFGHGFLDIRAALLPIGKPTLQMESGEVIGQDEPLLVSGTTTGDAVVSALAEQDVLVSDAMAGDFRLSAAALVKAAAPPSIMAEELADLRAGHLLTREDGAPVSNSSLFDRFPAAVMEFGVPLPSTEVRMMLPSGGGMDSNFGVGFEQSVAVPGGSVQFGLDLLRDGTGVLGAVAADDTTRPLAGNLTLGATANLVGDGFLTVQAGFGAASGSGAASATTFDSYELAVGTRNAFRRGDRLTMGVELPYAIRSGETSIALPVARDASGALEYSDMRIGLAPDRREVKLSVRYETPVAGSWNAMFEAAHSTNRGHIGGASETGFLIGFGTRF